MSNIGLVIADDSEFAPILRYAKQQGIDICRLNGDDAVRLPCGKNTVIAVCCGIGKTNAAAATAALCVTQKPVAMLNYGLSGAIYGVCKNQLVLGSGFVEHDFDLTPLGYAPGDKPQPVSRFIADERLNALLETAAGEQLARCVFATGDMFVSTSQRKKMLIDCFSAGCCDMETAAVASVCFKLGVPFASLRCASDDADEGSSESYRELNAREDGALFDIVMKTAEKIN